MLAKDTKQDKVVHQQLHINSKPRKIKPSINLFW